MQTFTVMRLTLVATNTASCCAAHLLVRCEHSTNTHVAERALVVRQLLALALVDQ
jgi:hypothetical protein